MHMQAQRLIGLVLTIASAMLFIFGAFHYAVSVAGTNWPLWFGVAGMVSGGVTMAMGCRGAQHLQVPSEAAVAAMG